MYNGTEQFIANGQPTKYNITDFWKWTSSDNVSFRSAIAEFVVASALDIADRQCGRRRQDIVTRDGFRIVVKAASYKQSMDPDTPDHVSFRLDPFDTVSDIHVFCVCKTMLAGDTPLDLDQWDFYVTPTPTIDDQLLWQKTVTLPKLMELQPYLCDYYGIPEAVRMATHD